VAGLADSLEEGGVAAAEAIDDGRALNALEGLRSASRSED